MPDTHLPDSRKPWPDLRSGAPGHDADDTASVRLPFPREPRLPLRAEPARPDGGVRPADGADAGAGPLPGGRGDASGGGGADGDALRPARGRGDIDGPNFNLEVPPDGYAWWYVDGISDDGRRALSVIAFIGSVFSPWYAWSGRKRPHNHVCVNVATYGPGGRFAMTDRGEAALRQSADCLTIGPSSLAWRGDRLEIDLDEVSSLPLVSRIRGRITLTPSAVTSVELPLLPDGSHVWRPFAPTSRIEVDLGPGWQWSGHGYFDSNFGTRALEADFSYWTWGRYPLADGSACFYDAVRRDGTRLEAGIRFTGDGRAETMALPPLTPVARSRWAVRRETRADPSYRPRQVLPMLDAPFYTRAAVRTRIAGEESVGVHEALDLDRFASPLLKPMLAVRVPRRAGWTFGD
jgi:carotenoid 1,2-hydratase